MDSTKKPKENPNRVRFVHKKPENYQSYYANGVFGSVTGRGDFDMNFFFEHVDIPEEEVMNVEEGELRLEEQNRTEVIVNRDFKVGIIMSPQQAEGLSNWIINALKEFKEKQVKK